MNKNRLWVSAGLFVLLLFTCFLHLMYGSCQTTKWHYVIQCYYMPDYLPYSLQRHVFFDGEIHIPPKYTGVWRSYYRNGVTNVHRELKNGVDDGEYKIWYEDGELFSKSQFKDGTRIGIHETYYNDGRKLMRVVYGADGERINGTYWDDHGNASDY